MAYVINKFDGTPLIVLEDGTLDTSTSVGLVGRNYIGYGEIQNENFLFLLENFANNNPPSRPLSGQTWYNKTTESLNVYTGTTWVSVNSAVLSSTAPTATPGSLWYNTDSNQLFLYNVDQWDLIGPEAVSDFGITKFQATTILDTTNTIRPIIKAIIDDTVIAICAKSSFEIDSTAAIENFTNLQAGITFASGFQLSGSVQGNASTASKLENSVLINGVAFDGDSNITVKSSTTNVLRPGDYLTGNQFDGSVEIEWQVDASSSNSIGKVVARDSNGDFSAGTVTANLIGDIVGNVTATIGTSTFNRVEADIFVGSTLSGNAFSATKLETGRQINGVVFDGTQDINIPVPAIDLTGQRLSPSVTETNITGLGVLTSLAVQDTGINIGDNNDVKFYIDQSQFPSLLVNNGQGLRVIIADTKQANNQANFEFMPSDVALAAGGDNDPAFVGDLNSKCNLGLPTRTFGNVYSDFFRGVATSAQYADLAENYTADTQYSPGTVLEFGGDFEVTVAQDNTRRIAGVVSTNPAYLMNSECVGEYVVSVALQGRILCKVKGNVSKGDMLVSAGSGYARASDDPKLGSVIGKALENFSGNEGTVEVVVGRI
jgi:hypothetical protein